MKVKKISCKTSKYEIIVQKLKKFTYMFPQEFDPLSNELLIFLSEIPVIFSPIHRQINKVL